MASITFFADHSEEPVLWVPPQNGAYTVEVGEGVGVVRTRSVKNAFEGALLHIPFVFVLIVAVVIVLSSVLPDVGDQQSSSSVIHWIFVNTDSVRRIPVMGHCIARMT